MKAMKAGAYDYLIKDPDHNYLRILPLTAENAVKHNNAEKQFRILSHAMMNIRDSVYIVDMNDSILFVNQAFTEIDFGNEGRVLFGPAFPLEIKITNTNHRFEGPSELTTFN